jgi:hypothetical protein
MNLYKILIQPYYPFRIEFAVNKLAKATKHPPKPNHFAKSFIILSDFKFSLNTYAFIHIPKFNIDQIALFFCPLIQKRSN